MPVVKFIDPDGTERIVRIAPGTTIMRAAVDNGIRGIIGECGGSGVCATCHCYVDDGWLHRLKEPGESETQLLECVGDPMHNSRLGCQVALDEACDGMVIRLPLSQT